MINRRAAHRDTFGQRLIRSIQESTWDKYIGIPYVEGGADFNGCTCWGLVHLVLKTECGIEVPTYGEVSAADTIAATVSRDQAGGTWQQVTTPRMFDVALMYAMTPHRYLGHVGIMTSPEHVLHVWKATDAVNMRIDHPRVRYRLVGFYRYGGAPQCKKPPINLRDLVGAL